MPRYFERLDLASYDVVISSSHACAVNVRTRPDTLHVCYCYTPIRYAWMPELEAGRASGVRRVGLTALRRRLRRIDLAASRRPSAYLAISESVRERIASYKYPRSVEFREHLPMNATGKILKREL